MGTIRLLNIVSLARTFPSSRAAEPRTLPYSLHVRFRGSFQLKGYTGFTEPVGAEVCIRRARKLSSWMRMALLFSLGFTYQFSHQVTLWRRLAILASRIRIPALFSLAFKPDYSTDFDYRHNGLNQLFDTIGGCVHYFCRGRSSLTTSAS